jgi:branched-chain amino acid transport system permease protein
MGIDISAILGQLLDGIGRGMIYFLLAAGLTLIFGVMNIVNFAHGVFYMLGVYLCFSVIREFSLGVGFILVPVILSLAGAVAEFGLFRRIYKAEHAMQLLLSTGVIYIVSDIVRLVWGVSPITLEMPALLKVFFNFHGILIFKYNLFVIGLTILIAAAMFLILYRTKIGSVIRACTFDPEMTICTGINVSRVFLLVFMVGTGLAGLAAVAASPMITAILGMDAQMIIVAFGVVIVGGAGSIGGALIAALVIGVVECLGILILPQFAEAFLYIIVVISLLLRPSGFFGKKVG